MSEAPVPAKPRTVFFQVAQQNDPKLKAVIHSEAYPAGIHSAAMREYFGGVLGRSHGKHGRFAPAIVSDDKPRARTLIAEALAYHPRHTSLEQTLRDFFSRIAFELLRHPNAYFEVVYAYPPDQPDATPLAFRLHPVPSGSIRPHRGRLIQFVPQEHAERRTRRGLGYRELGDAQLAHFHLDKALEQDLARALAALARPLLPSETDDYRDQRGANQARQAPSLTVATAPIGWHGGAVQFSNRLLRPYYAWRDLETLAFKIKLRDSVLNSLNSVLEQVGRRLELPMRVELENVTTLQQVHDAQESLLHGRQSLNELTRWALT